jgi:hypothetical protein
MPVTRTRLPICKLRGTVLAVGALNFPARCLFFSLQVLLTVRRAEYELFHEFQGGWLCFVATDLKRLLSFPLH